MDINQSTAEALRHHMSHPGDVHLSVERSSEEAPINPDLVLEGLRATVEAHGRAVGRTVFLGMFPEKKFPEAAGLFDKRFNSRIVQPQ
jgi:hypothetical protein